jgi:hypothetical protein
MCKGHEYPIHSGQLLLIGLEPTVWEEAVWVREELLVKGVSVGRH